MSPQTDPAGPHETLEQVTVVAADDERLVRVALRDVFTRDRGFRMLGEASSGRGAESAVDAYAPSVVILDIKMPGGDGLTAAQNIAARHPDLAIVFLTGSHSSSLLAAALALGVPIAGYLLKDTEPDELAAAVRHAVRGDCVISPVMTKTLLTEFEHTPRHDPSLTIPALDRLSGREVSVLRAIAAGMSNDEIARHLAISLATVKSHTSAVLAKLGVRDRLQAGLLARTAGLHR
jgi:DNA-binding NarL/FixJ family response regulator